MNYVHVHCALGVVAVPNDARFERLIHVWRMQFTAKGWETRATRYAILQSHDGAFIPDRPIEHAPLRADWLEHMVAHMIK